MECLIARSVVRKIRQTDATFARRRSALIATSITTWLAVNSTFVISRTGATKGRKMMDSCEDCGGTFNITFCIECMADVCGSCENAHHRHNEDDEDDAGDWEYEYDEDGYLV